MHLLLSLDCNVQECRDPHHLLLPLDSQILIVSGWQSRPSLRYLPYIMTAPALKLSIADKINT